MTSKVGLEVATLLKDLSAVDEGADEVPFDVGLLNWILIEGPSLQKVAIPRGHGSEIPQPSISKSPSC